MTDASPHGFTDVELIYQYFGKRLANAGRKEPVDRHLAELAEYCVKLEQVRTLVREAEESSARGESGPLDLEDVIQRGRERMAANGITDS
jgi:hypothetical protein